MRGVRHADGYLVRQLVVALHISVLLRSVQLILVFHRTVFYGRDRQRAMLGRNGIVGTRKVGRIAVGIQLNNLAVDGQRPALAVQIQRDLTGSLVLGQFGIAARRLIFRLVQGGFVYRRGATIGTRKRDARLIRIRRHVHRDARRRPVAVAVLNRIAEHILDIGRDVDRFAIRTSLQRIGVGAVRVQLQIPVGTFNRRTYSRSQFISPRTGRHTRHHMRRSRIVRTELIIDQHVAAAAARLRRSFREGNAVRLGRRHVVHDGHGDGAARRGAVHVRHGHSKVMENIVLADAAVLRGIAGKLVGELQLARGRVEARHRQDAFIRGNRVARELTVFKHGHVADDDAGHAVGRSDAQGAFGRGGRSAGGGTVRKAGFMDRQRLGTGFGVTRRHHDAVVHAVDGDGHLARGNVAVRIRVGVGELFRQRFVLGKFLHRRIVVIERVGVGAVFVQRDCAVLALLRRVRPRKVRAVRTGRRAFKGVAIDDSAASFRHVVPEALDGGHVVGDLDTDHSRAAVAVAVRHHHFHFVGDGLVRAVLCVFLGGLVQRIGIGQVRAVKAGHVQVPLIRLDGIARQGAVLPDDDTADGDGRHAVRGGDAHAAVGRRGAPAAAAIQGGFVHLEHIVRHGRRKIFSLDGDVRIIRIRAGSGRRHGHAVVVLIIRARLHRICGQLHAAVEADVQTPQMVEAVQQVAAAVFVVAAATRGAAAGSGASGGHQVFTKGREEILAADLHTFHLEGRHLFLGIRGVEILQLDGSAILESQDEVVAAAGQRRGIRRKVKDEAPVRSAGDGLCGTSGRLGKTDIGHEGPPKKK